MVRVLTINAGSSSLKAAAFDITATEESRIWHGQVDCTDHYLACQSLLEGLKATAPTWTPETIGHRIVHGGTTFLAPTIIDESVVTAIESLTPLAPLHQPANVAGIKAAQQLFPSLPQFACFDTAFHANRGFVREAYALPREYFERGIRRYGFHGLSYQFICTELRNNHPELAHGKVIICHLGNGASMTAINACRSVETTMGFTPTDGLIMGTRCGQIDPGILLHLIEHDGLTSQQLAKLLTKQSGLLGLSGGLSSDMRHLLSSDRPESRQAIELFVYRCQYHIGALAAALQGIEGLIFTGGIGEHASSIRESIVAGLAWLGADLDLSANSEHQRCISTASSRFPVLVIPTDEERTIARAALAMKP
jgi:acetate kinase